MGNLLPQTKTRRLINFTFLWSVFTLLCYVKETVSTLYSLSPREKRPKSKHVV